MTAELSIKESEILQGVQAEKLLSIAIEKNKTGLLTYLNTGRWYVSRIEFENCTQSTLLVRVQYEYSFLEKEPKLNQPVGLSFQIDFDKYIFETLVHGIESKNGQQINGKILLGKPDRIQKIHRRAYRRVQVPKELNVKVLFWHRGYMDRQIMVPRDYYWQGNLLDLSAGGMRIEMDPRLKDCFSTGQILGLQFTPMFYQKPILAEGMLRHIREDTDKDALYLGVEFLGLESSVEGRKILQHLLEIVDEYRRIGQETNV